MSSSDTSTEPVEEAEDSAPEPDEAREALLAGITSELGDAVVGSEIQPGVGLWVRVAAEAWGTAGLAARDRFGFRWFDFLSAIDWLPSPYGRYEDDGFGPTREPDTQIVTGVGGGETRFQLLARVVDVVAKTDLILKADVPGDTMTVPTWVPAYSGADWHEREAWEMFGITFEGHPGLRHMYLPGDFEGNPLRKDFPLLARVVKPWPGIVDVEPMPEETESDAPGEEAAPTEDAAPAEPIPPPPEVTADAAHSAEAPAGAASDDETRMGEALPSRSPSPPQAAPDAPPEGKET